MPRNNNDLPMPEATPKDKIKGAFEAEYDMWYFEYVRIQKLCHELCLVVAPATRCFDTRFLMRHWALLKEIYLAISPLVYVKEKEVLRKQFGEVRKKVFHCYEENTLDLQTVDALDDLYEKLMEIKQLCGMGVRVHRKEDNDDLSKIFDKK